MKAARWMDAIQFLALPGLLLILVGPRVELIGVAVGIGLLAVGKGSLGSAVAAGLIAVGTGFRVLFITDPSGGYYFLNWISIPFTCGWIVLLIQARDGLRRAVPRRGPQLGVDLILAVTAALLVLASPQTRSSPLASSLPLATLAFVLLGLGRGARGGVDHAVVAFALGLFGISGAMKGAVSVSLLGPLVALGVPLFATARLGFSPGTAGFAPAARSLLAWGTGTAAFAVAGVGIAQGAPEYAGISGAIVAVIWAVSRAAARFHPSEFWAGEGKRYLFGIGFDAVTLADAARRVEGMIQAGQGGIVVTPNPAALITALSDPTLRSTYSAAELVLPDGIGIVWASRLLGIPLPARVTGVDLAEELLGSPGLRVFLLGGRPGVAARAGRRLRRLHPGLEVVGTHHGYFSDDERVIATVARAAPDLVLVGMGVPRQERFMAAVRDRLPVMIGVGGALDLFAGDVSRAPAPWRRVGLEWAYRIIHQPRRAKELVGIVRFSARTAAAWVALTSARLAAQAD